MKIIFQEKTQHKWGGGACLFIVLTHTADGLVAFNPDYVYLSQFLGECFVGVFLMLSAYCLLQQYKKNNKKYLLKILIFKIPYLYFWMVVINLVFFLIFHSDSPNIALSILGFDLKNDLYHPSWYIKLTIIFYTFFVLIYFFIKNIKIASIIMAIIPMIWFFQWWILLMLQ